MFQGQKITILFSSITARINLQNLFHIFLVVVAVLANPVKAIPDRFITCVLLPLNPSIYPSLNKFQIYQIGLRNGCFSRIFNNCSVVRL